MTAQHYTSKNSITYKWAEVEKILRALVAADLYLTAEEKAQYDEQQLAAVGIENVTPLPTAEPQPQAPLSDTVQATPEIVAEITQSDIDTALLHWNGDADSKARVLAYMQDHSRERGTAD